MSITKKITWILLFASLFSLSLIFVYSQQDFNRGCCTNPGAGILVCSTERLVHKDECCPQPENENEEYYDVDAGGPENYNICNTNPYFIEGKICDDPEITQCQLGCCCSYLSGKLATQTQCSSQDLTFHIGETDCISVCSIPECNDNVNNDPENNDCNDYPIDSGCLSPSDPTESGGICLEAIGQNCGSISYVPKIINFQAIPVKGQKKIELQWENECRSNIVSHDIYRCKGSGCNDFMQIGTTAGNIFIDEDDKLRFLTTYTYKVVSHYSIQTAQPEKITRVFSGNLECWNKLDNNNFCIHESYYNQYKNHLIGNFAGFSEENFKQSINSFFTTKLNKAFYCSSTNVLSEEVHACSSNQVCVVSDNTPLCIEYSDCNPESSNIFGLFFTRNSCEGTDNDKKYCFYDRSFSIVDTCFACGSQMFCYDYKSEESCNKDNCYVGNCGWESLSAELGTGVCINKNLDNCQWCDNLGTEGIETSRVTSSIFEQCTAEKAQKLSSEQNTCYYDGQKALNCQDIICTDYSTDNCVSNDECGLNICQSFSNGCRKNADGDNKQDCAENDMACEQDVFAPNTTITPIIDRGAYKSLFIEIFDKTSSKGFFIRRSTNDYKTFICKGTSCEPKNGVFTNAMSIKIINLKLFDALTGEKIMELSENSNILGYYSQDPSKNLGKKKTVELIAHADSSGPVVFKLDITNGKLVDGIYYTNSMAPTIGVEFFEEARVTSAKLLLKGTDRVIPAQSTNELAKTIEFPFSNLNPGEYIFELNAKNDKNIFMDEVFKADIVIDNTKPQITIDPGEGVIIKDTSQIPIILAFDKKVNLESVVINGEEVKDQFSTEDSKVHHAVITLADGNKQIIITAKDFAGNGMTFTSTFIVNTNPLDIRLEEPSFGVSSTPAFGLVITTDNDADCRYSLDNSIDFNFMDQFDVTGGTEHKKENFDKISDKKIHKLYVACNDNDQDPAVEKFDLSVDQEAPKINQAFANPEKIAEEPRNTILKIEANKDVICKYSKDNVKDFNSMEGTFNGFENKTFYYVNSKEITVDADGSYSYFAACMSKAELISETKEIRFNADINSPLELTSHTLEYSNSTTITLAIETNKKSQCKYSRNDPSVGQGQVIGPPSYSHIKTLVLESGKYTYYVICKDQYLQKWSDPLKIDFTIDTTPPLMVFVDDTSTLANNPEYTWRIDRLRAKWLGKDNETKVKSYEYTLEEFGALNAITNWTTIVKENEWIFLPENRNVSLSPGSKYFFRFKARNIVGLISEALESNGIVIDPSLKPTNCSNNIKDPQESDIDCGGQCDLCIEGKICRENSDCSSRFCDENNKCKSASCSDNARNQDESDIDCGGNNCEKCENTKNCNENADCSSSFCSFGICKESDSCNDGRLSGTESDIDCGGACPNRCQLEQSCDADADCRSGLSCTLGRCLEELIEETEKDTDGDGIPDEWELQQGLDPNDPSDAELDFDNDGLTNLEEYTYRTNPNKADTDGDGVSDKKEIDKSTDPLDPLSKPKGFLGTFLLILFVILLLSGGSYGAYYYYQNYMNKPKQKPEMLQLEPLPAFTQKTPAQKALQKKPKKTGIFKKRQAEKHRKRERLFDVFGKKKETGKISLSKDKEEKPLLSKAKIIQETPEQKHEEDIFSRLQLISKREKEKKRYKNIKKPEPVIRKTRKKPKKKHKKR